MLSKRPGGEDVVEVGPGVPRMLPTRPGDELVGSGSPKMPPKRPGEELVGSEPPKMPPKRPGVVVGSEPREVGGRAVVIPVSEEVVVVVVSVEVVEEAEREGEEEEEEEEEDKDEEEEPPTASSIPSRRSLLCSLLFRCKCSAATTALAVVDHEGSRPARIRRSSANPE
jgi:hypothetical protein